MAKLSSIVVTPPSPAVIAGEEQQFIATGIYSNGDTEELTDSAAWGSSDPSIASIDQTGLATSLAPGATTITAQAEGVGGSTMLIVGEMALDSIAVAPSAMTLQVGQTQQYAAIGTFTDGSQQNLTAYVTWGSSAPAIVSVTPSGFATALAAGNADITAESGEYSASGSLTVQTTTTAPPQTPAPCVALQQAIAQQMLLLSGKGVAAVETPQLGRVEFTKAEIGDLQRLIQQLAAQCAACGGPLPPGYVYRPRRPISIEACP